MCCESDHRVSTSLDFMTIIFLQSKVISLASNPQPEGPGSCIYVSHWHGGPVVHPGTRLTSCHLHQLTGLWWMYSNPRPHGKLEEQYRLKSEIDLLCLKAWLKMWSQK
jgi:hypothetical protein